MGSIPTRLTILSDVGAAPGSIPEVIQKAKNILYGILFVAGRTAIPVLPRALVVGLARACGRIAAALPLHVTRVANSNLSLVMPDLDLRQRRTIIRISFSSLALTLLDLFWLSVGSGKRLRQVVEGDPSMGSVLREGPMVCLTAHYGNWEILGHLLPLHGYPMTSVSSSTGSPTLDRRINALRGRHGQVIASRRGAARVLLGTLRRGDKVGLLLDQNTRPDEGGAFLEFFGKPVPVSLLPATLAIHTDSPVSVGFCIPDLKTGRYRAYSRVVLDEHEAARLQPDQAADLAQRIIQEYEHQICSRPEFWLWSYKRWKHVPPTHELSSFPFYAKPYPPRRATSR
ncbi:MAG TPA: hypothetical protein EYP62_03475 [Kiritimatiellae bacterium]|nr:hypothetical protein [Kiritimatiellia bacterium]